MSAAALVGGLVLLPSSGATETDDAVRAPVAQTAASGLADGAQQSISAGDAGTFVVQRVGDTLTIVSVAPSAGWTFDVLANDAERVKVSFNGASRLVFAAAVLADDGTVESAVFDKALPVAAPATVPAAPVKAASTVKAAAVEADTDHDGWCDHDRDGVDDRTEAASFDRDGDGFHRDGGGEGDRDGWRRDGRDGFGDRDGR